jgi:5-methylcytosine-specific restriction enzyme A
MRSVPEWIGKSDDEPVPSRVKDRVHERARGLCASCGREIYGGDAKEIDHVKAICNGGENRESNLQLLCGWCHAPKTRADVTAKREAYASRMKHLGFRPTSRRRLPHGKDAPTKKKITGEVIRRE